MKFTIRKATEDDFPEILEMINELADFVGYRDRVTNTVAQMKSEKQYFNCVLAEDENGEILGMALYFFAYFTWIGKSLYLDDLIVREKYRGNTIGTALLNELFSIAKNSGCKRVRWQVLTTNPPAIAFYKKLGASIDDEAMNCDFDEQQIRDLG